MEASSASFPEPLVIKSSRIETENYHIKIIISHCFAVTTVLVFAFSCAYAALQNISYLFQREMWDYD